MGCPPEYRGNLFFCDWGLQTVDRYEVKKAGGTFTVARHTPFVTKGAVKDFRPFSLAVAGDGASLWLVDWAYDGWLADGPQSRAALPPALHGCRSGLFRFRVPEGRRPGAPAQVARPPVRWRFAWNRSGFWLRRVPKRSAILIQRLKTDRARDRPAPCTLGSRRDRWPPGPIRDRRRCWPILRLRCVCKPFDRWGFGVIKPLSRPWSGCCKDRDPAVRREAAIAAGKVGWQRGDPRPVCGSRR